MAKVLILWEMNQASMPADPAERAAVLGKLAEMTKKALDTGKVKDWGIFAGGSEGYSIADETAVDTLSRTMQFAPYIKFQVNPVLSMAEVAQVMQSMQG